MTQDYPRREPPPPAVDPATGQAMEVTAPESAEVDNGSDMHCQNEADCQSARIQREPMWLDKQFKFWKIDWDKYRRIQQYEAEQAARTRFGTGIYALTADEEPDPEFTAALEQVRLAVEHNLQAPAQVQLAAPAAYIQPSQPPGSAMLPQRKCREPGCTHTTIQCCDNRRHTLGHFRQHPQVHSAADAVARKAVLARQQGQA